MFFYLKEYTQSIFNFFLNFIFQTTDKIDLSYAYQKEKIDFFRKNTETIEILNKLILCKQKNRWIYYTFQYKNPLVKNLIWQLKFRGQKKISETIGFFMGEFIFNFIKKFNIKEFIIVPVPIHRKRRIERGFNQTELISKYIKKYLNLKNINNFYVDTKNLKKIKETKKQSWKNRSERLEKQDKIFYIKDREFFNDKVIFIIDDVVTTGKTLQDIKEELNKTNPKKIIGICFAGG